MTVAVSAVADRYQTHCTRMIVAMQEIAGLNAALAIILSRRGADIPPDLLAAINGINARQISRSTDMVEAFTDTCQDSAELMSACTHLILENMRR